MGVSSLGGVVLRTVSHNQFDTYVICSGAVYETLGKISGNLNQIAKRINSTGNIYEEDMAEVKAIMDQVWKTQKAMLKKQPLIRG